MNKILTAIFVILTLLAITFNSPASAADINSGAKIFSANCAGCHPKGGNIIRRGKNLQQRALHRNHLDSTEAIVALVTKGKNNMSAFGDRLSERQIEDVAAFVLDRARSGWR